MEFEYIFKIIAEGYWVICFRLTLLEAVDESELMVAAVWVMGFFETKKEWMFGEETLFAEELVKWGSS